MIYYYGVGTKGFLTQEIYIKVHDNYVKYHEHYNDIVRYFNDYEYKQISDLYCALIDDIIAINNKNLDLHGVLYNKTNDEVYMYFQRLMLLIDTKGIYITIDEKDVNRKKITNGFDISIEDYSVDTLTKIFLRAT